MNTNANLGYKGPQLPKGEKLPRAIVISEDGTQARRTIHGYMLAEDIAVICREYPEVPRDFVEMLVERDADHVELIPAPRLLEVLVVMELTTRWLRDEYSKIREGIPEGLRIVANPLSILSFVDDVVQRVVAVETELMHKAAEKLALRTGALEKINEALDKRFGMQLAYGCSCCALAFATKDREAVLATPYYVKREQMGRHWDSDVLAALGRLHGPMRIGDVPQVFLDGSVDFGETEVMSYTRFARVAQACIDEHPHDNIVDINEWYLRAACFIGGQCKRESHDHCPLPPHRL